MQELTLGLTFDDVLLVPQHSDVLPADVDLATRFSRNVPLQVPLVSAAMERWSEKCCLHVAHVSQALQRRW